MQSIIVNILSQKPIAMDLFIRYVPSSPPTSDTPLALASPADNDDEVFDAIPVEVFPEQLSSAESSQVAVSLTNHPPESSLDVDIGSLYANHPSSPTQLRYVAKDCADPQMHLIHGLDRAGKTICTRMPWIAG